MPRPRSPTTLSSLTPEQAVRLVHDLKQPLFLASFYLSELQHGSLPPELSPLAADARQQLAQMEGMLSQLRAWAGIDADRYQPQPGPLALRPMFLRLQAEFGPRLRIFPTRQRVIADGQLLFSLLRQLLSNAARHAAPGDYLLGCRRDGASVRLELIDLGPGLPEQVLAAPGRPFQRPARPDHPGLGLGLAIAHRLAGQLGSSLCVQHRRGSGTRLQLALPAVDSQ